MRISKIKLAGFKSFVDPTTLVLPDPRTAIVGPNGCGKSNIVDAINWVLGESSAKHLRGESITDVIFSGSSTRKPVGKASVELIFDNSDGGAGGQFAGFGEISLKRRVSRDGVSVYYLNGTRCRRKDITALFLGTGVGSRGYSVIEQGTISRIIESKPEEMRVFLEEAASISKYKERRRETQLRLGHTRENLERLADIRSELETQLTRLTRQAKIAERFKALKEEERAVKGEYLALRCRGLQSTLGEREQEIAQQLTKVEAVTAELRAVERTATVAREEQTTATDTFNAVQSRFYAVGADLARLEQALQHASERRASLESDLSSARGLLDTATKQLSRDGEQLDEVQTSIRESGPMEVAAGERESQAARDLEQQEAAMSDWQIAWDTFNRKMADSRRDAEVSGVRHAHLERDLADADQRIKVLRDEHGRINSEALVQRITELQNHLLEAENRHNDLQARHDTFHEKIRTARETVHRLNDELDERRTRKQSMQGRQASLSALQDAALGKDQDLLAAWLSGNALDELPRLGQVLSVEAGWEKALETVIRIPLDTLCGDPSKVRPMALPKVLIEASHNERPAGAVHLLESQAGDSRDDQPHADGPHADGSPDDRLSAPLAQELASKVTCEWPVSALLAGVYAVESLDEAWALRPSLASYESLVTRDGYWLGRGWLKIPGDDQENEGVLARERHLKSLAAELNDLHTAVDERVAALNRVRTELHEWELEDREIRKELEQLRVAVNQRRSEFVAKQAHLEQARERMAAIDTDLTHLAASRASNSEEIELIQAQLSQAEQATAALETERGGLSERRERLQRVLQEARDTLRGQRDARHELALRLESWRSQAVALDEILVRNREQVTAATVRRDELLAALEHCDEPLEKIHADKERALEMRLAVENEMSAARAALQRIDATLRTSEDERLQLERALEGGRDKLEELRIGARESEVRLQDLQEQLSEITEEDLASILQRLPENAEEDGYRARSADIERGITRLGPINLAAIDECAEITERKTYLDDQHADLTEAVQILEGAIHKIDKETRVRFQEIFDKVNAGFQAMFPVLFGGGRAYLEMTGGDLLETGIALMARPPGKRNSTIHLLSGGEKALTALALVFAIFELNPAPFCLLDEVDAPLDDVNVVRLGDLLKKMSETVQFIIITHNKITMEIADQLIGVTMQEPGISHLVSVNMDEAVTMAAAG